MAKPLRYQETSEEIIINMDEELFAMKKNGMIMIIGGVVFLIIMNIFIGGNLGGVLGSILQLVVSVLGLLIIGMGGWFLYSLNNRLDQTENWIRERYEKQARKKGKSLVITYNPEGQQFYTRQG